MAGRGFFVYGAFPAAGFYRIWNRLTSWFKVRAWPERSLDAAALSSAEAAFACTTWEIIWECREMAAISSISFLMGCTQLWMTGMAETARPVDFVPVFTSWIDRLAKPLVFWAASVDLEAKFRTSSATTEKSFPAVPARAASTKRSEERRVGKEC